MYFVSTIAKNKDVREYLNKHFDIEKLRKIQPHETQPVLSKSNGIFGIIAEQLILINSYKKGRNRAIKSSINKHINRIKEFRSNIYRDLNEGEIKRWANSNTSFTIFYNNKYRLENDPQYLYYKQSNLEIKPIKPFKFIENIDKFEFQYQERDHTYFIDNHLFFDFVDNCLNMLEKSVYSKFKLSNYEAAKLLLFENIIFYHPIYLSGTLSPYQQNIQKLFLNYNDEISAVCKMVEVNSENIEKAGTLISYQDSCSYKNIRGRVDFVTNKSILEIKIVSKLSTQDFYQILLYTLISRTNEACHLNHIEFINLLNLNLGKYYSYDVNKIIKGITQNPEYILDKINSILEKQK